MTAPLAAYNFDEESGAILDLSGNGLDIPFAPPAVRAAGHTDLGLVQTGTGVFLGPAGYAADLLTPNRTIMAWIKDEISITGWVFEFWSAAINSGIWGILFLSSQWHIQARNASSLARASIARPTDSQWHHFAGTYDGANVRAYFDGVLAATVPLAGPLRTDGDEFRVQDNSSTSLTTDDVRYFDVALSQAEIVSLMNTPVTGGRSGKPKVWDGSTWSPRQAKLWNGSSWDNVTISGYDGGQWTTSK